MSNWYIDYKIINDYFEFPVILDMAKYTDDNSIIVNKLQDQKYNLKSVIIHIGDNKAGHYYWFAKDS